MKGSNIQVDDFIITHAIPIKTYLLAWLNMIWNKQQWWIIGN